MVYVSLIKDNEHPADIVGTREVASMADLGSLITQGPWSPSIYTSTRRNKANFMATKFVGLDVDGNCTLDQALELFKDYRCVIATTRSHQKQKGTTPACDRFRVVLELDANISNSAIYAATWDSLQAKFPFIDKACKDVSRLFYASREVVFVNENGSYVPVVYPSTAPKALTPVTLRDDWDLENLTESMQKKMLSAIKYLRKMPLAIQGSGRNIPTFTAACRLVDPTYFELPRNAAIYLLDNCYNEEKCQPKWSKQDIERKVDDAIIKVNQSKPSMTAKGLIDESVDVEALYEGLK